jgi:hypothetical protein
MGNVRIYEVVPASLFTPNYERDGGRSILRSLAEIAGARARFSYAVKVIWAVVPEESVFSDSHSSRISMRAPSGTWKDLTEEDLQVFKLEEKMDGLRARELRIQPLNFLGTKNG